MASSEARQEQGTESDEWALASVRIRKVDLKAIDMAAVLEADHRSGFMAKASAEHARRVLEEHGIAVPG
jgi:uncharacterized protein (DUF1778 family)